MPDPSRVLILAPNWVGDAVMALPAIHDLRRAYPSAKLIVAARRPVIDVFRLAAFVDELIPLERPSRWWQRATGGASAAQLKVPAAQIGVLLPNSFASAWLMKQAGVPERWGFATDMRGALLTRAIPKPPARMHQGAYYQHLTRELGFESGPPEPALAVPEDAVISAREALSGRGWDGSRPLVVFAPGAAYGNAKRWIPAHVSRAITRLARERRTTCVLVGGPGDRATARQIANGVDPDVASSVVDTTGDTIVAMAAVIAAAAACVSNDSGAMHLAAALGTPVVALFGPTSEYETGPLTRAGRRAVVLTNPVWCRPCRLRECPIDHRCMKGIRPEDVVDAVQDVSTR